MKNISTRITTDAIEIFLTKQGFYNKPLEEMEEIMGTISFEAYNALEIARLEAIELEKIKEEED